MTNKPLINSLGAALQGEVQELRALLAATEAQQIALGKRDAIELSASTQEMARKIEACRVAQMERKAIERKLASSPRVRSGSVSASLDLSTVSGGSALQALQGQIKSLKAEIAENQERNRRMVDHSLDLLQGDFEALDGLVRKSRGEQEGDSKRAGVLLSLKA